MKEYYFFVTSLKNLSWDMDSSPYSLAEYQEEALEAVKDGSDDDDDRLLRAIFYRPDNLLSDVDDVDEDNEDKRIPKLGYVLEDELNTYYYRYLMKVGTDFLRQYTHFDFTLKNIISALNCRKYSLNAEEKVLPLNIGPFTDYRNLIDNAAKDFGLSVDLDWLPAVLSIYYDNQDSPRAREFALDKLRFEKINELLEFEYFNINQIVGYYLKLMIVDRWAALKRESREGSDGSESRGREKHFSLIVDKIIKE